MVFGSQSTCKLGLELLILTWSLLYNFAGGSIFSSFECVANASIRLTCYNQRNTEPSWKAVLIYAQGMDSWIGSLYVPS